MDTSVDIGTLLSTFRELVLRFHGAIPYGIVSEITVDNVSYQIVAERKKRTHIADSIETFLWKDENFTEAGITSRHTITAVRHAVHYLILDNEKTMSQYPVLDFCKNVTEQTFERRIGVGKKTRSALRTVLEYHGFTFRR